jgi:pimeloyl-ACP methyl ester carboxylesterase
MANVQDVPLTVLPMTHGALTYAVRGEGSPIVCLHGLPGSVRDFRRLDLALADQPVRLIRLNLPGFGASAPLPRKSDSQALVDCLVEAARQLSGGPHVLVGHSFGANLALRCAAQSSDVRALALLAPVGLRPHAALRRLPPAWTLLAMRRSEFAKALFHRGLARTGLGAHTSRAESDNTLALLSRMDLAPARRAVHTLRIPTFAAYCRDDEVVERVIVEELIAALSARALAFDEGGHVPQKRHADAIAAALVELTHAALTGAHVA